MPYTLGEAAKRTGLSKPTIQRAIKNGKLSATRNEDGSYSIDPAELARVYPESVTGDSDANRHMKRDETPNEAGGLQVELAVLRERLASVTTERERERDQLTREIEDLRRRLDRSEDTWRDKDRQLTALLAAPPKPETPPLAPATTENSTAPGRWNPFRAFAFVMKR